MKKTDKIYIAGHRGLVGSAILRRLKAEGYTHLVLRTHAELDLTRQADVEAFFAAERPDHVFLAAAKVGGIHANHVRPADFIYQNEVLQANVLHAAHAAGVKRLLFLGSSCIYPRRCPQPMKEAHLLTGPLEPTNRPYALAKIAGIAGCEAFNRQHGTRFLSVMPTNLYGPGDNFDLESSHVLPALVRKFHLARLAMEGDAAGIEADERTFGPIPDDIRGSLSAIARKYSHDGFPIHRNPPPTTDHKPGGAAAAPAVILWGSGAPLREFLHVDDMADGCLFLMNLDEELYGALLAGKTDPAGAPYGDDPMPMINLGTGKDASIAKMAKKVAEVVGYTGDVVWDAAKPDGTPRKLLDVSRMAALGWGSKISLADGLRSTYVWYLEQLK